MRVTVIIPNWNGRDLLPACLASLRQARSVLGANAATDSTQSRCAATPASPSEPLRGHTISEGVACEVGARSSCASEASLRPISSPSASAATILLVDNGSTDGSVAWVRENYPEVRVLELGENRGFAAAVNAGFRASATPYVALLNNDVEVAPGWLAALVAALDAFPEAGFAASKMLDFVDRRRIDGAGDAFTWEGNAYRIGHGEEDRGQYDAPGWVFGACGGAAIYRRDMLDRIGLFDETFFAYYEDADLSFRARLAGYRCRYVPEAVVYHLGSATSRRNPERTFYLQTRNRLAVVIKNYPAVFLVAMLPLVLRFQARVLLRAHRAGQLRPVSRVFTSLIADLPHLLRARRATQRLRTIRNRDLARIVDAPPSWWHGSLRRP